MVTDIGTVPASLVLCHLFPLDSSENPLRNINRSSGPLGISWICFCSASSAGLSEPWGPLGLDRLRVHP